MNIIHETYENITNTSWRIWDHDILVYFLFNHVLDWCTNRKKNGYCQSGPEKMVFFVYILYRKYYNYVPYYTTKVDQWGTFKAVTAALGFFLLYCVSQKSRLFVYIEYTMKISQDFLDKRYISVNSTNRYWILFFSELQ